MNALFIQIENFPLYGKTTNLNHEDLPDFVLNCHESFVKNKKGELVPARPTSESKEFLTKIFTIHNGALHCLKIIPRKVSDHYLWHYVLVPLTVEEKKSVKEPATKDCKFDMRCTNKKCSFNHPNGKYCFFAMKGTCTNEDCTFVHPPEQELIV